MKTSLKINRGFTLLELLVVISIIAILAAALFPLFGMIRQKMRDSLARNTMGNITMALEHYRADWNDFPPDNTPTSNGSEMIWFYLCRVMQPTTTTGELSQMHYGPYLKINPNQLTDVDGNNKISVASWRRISIRTDHRSGRTEAHLPAGRSGA